MQRRLPDWISSYLHYTRLDESPEVFHRWTAYAILAAAVNRNCWMDRGYYKLFPNLYVLFIGPSGVGKSSSSGIGVDILRETSLQVNIYKDFITPPALIEFMSRSSVSTEFKVGEKTIITNKTPLLLYASELGNLLSLRSGVRELTMLLTELFNKQGDHEDTTNSRGSIKIKKPNVTFLGCCFPEWIEEELVSISLRSGFLGRMLVVTARSKRHRLCDITLSEADIQLRLDLIHDLEIIGAIYGEMEWEPEAHTLWHAWYNAQPMDMGTDDKEIAGFSSRRAQFLQRLAMLTSISRGNGRIISASDFNIAEKLVMACEHNIKDMGDVSDSYKQVIRVKRNLIAYAKGKSNVEIDLSTLMRRMSKSLSKKQLDEVLEQLDLERFIEIKGRKITIRGITEAN